MRGEPWTPADDAAISDMIARDIGAKAIGQAIGRSSAAVRRRAVVIGASWSVAYRQGGLKLGGQVLAAQKKAKRQAMIAQAVALHTECKTATEIAEIMGQKRPTVLKYLCEAGYGRPKGRKPRKVADPKPKYDVRQALDRAIAAVREQAEANWRKIAADVRADVDAGMTLLDAAAKYGRGREYLRRWLMHDGWSRPKPEPKPKARAKVGMAWLNRAGLPKRVERASTLYTDAATWLAPHYRPVVRADIVDDPYSAPKGEPREYIVGKHRMPALDMLDVARGLGFPG